MPLRSFDASPRRTAFRDVATGLRAVAGAWRAPFYAYVDVRADGRTHQYLLVSDRRTVRFEGAERTLHERRCPLSGEDTFAKPGTYVLAHKVFA